MKAEIDENRADRINAEAAMIEAPEVPHAHHGSGHRWFDIVLGLAVVLVSIASLYVSLHTGTTMEALVEQNARLVRANSTPLLVWSHGNAGANGEPVIEFTVENAGTGPARVSWVELSYKGKKFNMLRPYLSEMGAPSKFDLTYISSPVANTMIKAGSEVRIIGYRRPSTEAELSAWKILDRERFKIDTTACYCSLLNECWVSHMQADIPKPVAACEPAGHKSFNDYVQPTQSGAIRRRARITARQPLGQS